MIKYVLVSADGHYTSEKLQQQHLELLLPDSVLT